MVLASVAIAVKIKTPPEEGPRVLGDRISVSHILNPDYRPRHFNGSWISGKIFEKLSYRKYDENIILISELCRNINI